ncbi:hypothetical protein QFZ72_002799 [Bacillus sp. V2I10]|nr:hypothetical protein [Bacillus sp. V2I10]
MTLQFHFLNNGKLKVLMNEISENGLHSDLSCYSIFFKEANSFTDLIKKGIV